MARHGRSNSVSLLLGCAGLLVASTAFGQQASPPPASGQPSKTKVVRRPIVDLKKQAQEPRPGQVLPGLPQPKPPEAEPAVEPTERPAPPAPVPAAAEPPTVAPAPVQPAQSQPAVATPPSPAATVPPQEAVTPPPPTSVPPTAPPAQQPAQDRSVDLPNPTQPPPTRTPAAKVTKPLKPAPIPVTAETKPAPAPAVAPPVATESPTAPPVAEPPPAATPATAPSAEPVVDSVAPAPTAEPDKEVAAGVQPVEPIAAESAPVAEAVAAPAGEPIRVQVTSVDGPPDVIQWRVDEGVWKSLAVSEKAEGRIGLRTGLGAAATFTLADQVTVRVSRLTRVRFEQRTPAKPGMPIELVVELSRGEVDIKPLPLTPGGPTPAVVRVITPDKNFTTRLATGVRFDAFSGTRLKLVGGEK